VAFASYEDSVLTSSPDFGLRMRIPEGFRCVGSFTFDLSAGARVERHVFVEGRPEVRRMIVVHLEAFLPGVEDLYRYALADPVVLGGETYGRSTSVLSLREERTTSAEAEMARTEEFLRSKGFALGDRQAVARYARIVGQDRRKEILIFYHEIGGPEAGILERARDALHI
jgi:hypothetical protein